jgi:hypothetical protein
MLFVEWLFYSRSQKDKKSDNSCGLGNGILDALTKVLEGWFFALKWDTPQFSTPGRSLRRATLGRITWTITDNREMQFGLNYFF